MSNAEYSPQNIEPKWQKYWLENKTFKAEKDETRPKFYALDMFHMVKKPKELLAELARIVKTEGKIIIEDGHQPRSETLIKIEGAGLFTIPQQNKHHVVCNLSKDKI